MRIEKVRKLKGEIVTLEKSLEKLKKELSSLQQNCDHRFERQTFVRVCQKCSYSDSTLW